MIVIVEKDGRKMAYEIRPQDNPAEAEMIGIEKKPLIDADGIDSAELLTAIHNALIEGGLFADQRVDRVQLKAAVQRAVYPIILREIEKPRSKSEIKKSPELGDAVVDSAETTARRKGKARKEQ